MEYDESGLAYDGDLEKAVLGALLIKPESVKTVLGNVKLTKDSFFFEKNQNVLNVILELTDQGTKATDLLVSSHLNGTVPTGYITDLSMAYSGHDVVDQCKRLVELQRWRERRSDAMLLLESTKDRDLEKYAKARNSIDNDEMRVNSLNEPKQIAATFRAFMENKKVDSFALPYAKFNHRMAGGLRRKQMTLIGGWSSHGKSVVIDEFLETFAKAGKKCHLYINEMGIEDRVARSISRETGIQYSRLLQHNTTAIEKEKIHKALDGGCPYFAITECAGWSIQELAYDIKSREFDVVGIDILHQFDYDSEGELARISRMLNRVTKQANCHIIATVHLNEFRANDIVRPRPVLRDIRGSGMLKNDADNVMFIHREQDPHCGDPCPPATIYTSKVRNGQIGYVDLMFNESTFSFSETEGFNDKPKP